MKRDQEPSKEGHTREWQDRARVVIDAKEAAATKASPKQSPLPGDDVEDVHAKNSDDPCQERRDNDSVY